MQPDKRQKEEFMIISTGYVGFAVLLFWTENTSAVLDKLLRMAESSYVLVQQD